MKVDHNRKVSVSYTLTVNGKVEDQADSNNPLEFVFGHGELLPSFEDALLGLEPGAEFNTTLPPEQGYGVYDERNKVRLPMQLFELNDEEAKEMLQVGNTIPMTTHQGTTMVGKVLEVLPDAVLMDFNHPLCGQTLHFTGKVENVRDLTFEEVQELLSRNAGSCSCGCSCGCEDDEDEGCGCSGGCGHH